MEGVFRCDHCGVGLESLLLAREHLDTCGASRRRPWLNIFVCLACEFATNVPAEQWRHVSECGGLDKQENDDVDENVFAADFEDLGEESKTDIDENPSEDLGGCNEVTDGEDVEGEDNEDTKAEVRSHLCDECGFTTERLNDYRSHLRSDHSKQRPHACDECPYRATQASALKRHTAAKHGDNTEKAFICTQCDYSTSNKDCLRMHTRSLHSGRRDFPCGQCDYAAKTNAQLKVHVWRVHERPKETFHCSRCDFKSRESNAVRLHELKEHDIRHEHQCVFCGYVAHAPSALKKHVEGVHEKKKSHLCPECGFGTPYRGGMEDHLRRMHGRAMTGVKRRRAKRIAGEVKLAGRSK